MKEFDIVTPEWIKSQLDASGMKKGELSDALGIYQSRLSKYLNGVEIPTMAKAAIFYYFKSRDLDHLQKILKNN